MSGAPRRWAAAAGPSLLLMALGFAGGFFCARATAPARVEREAEAIEQVRTVVVRERVEVERQARASERIVERRVVEPCPVCAGEAPAMAAATAATAAMATTAVAAIGAPALRQPTIGRAVIEERVIERALSSSARLGFEGSGIASGASRSAHAAERIEGPPPLPRWRLSALVGYAWGEGAPVYGLAVGVRLIGPLEVGAWGATSAELRGAAGVSAGVRW